MPVIWSQRMQNDSIRTLGHFNEIFELCFFNQFNEISNKYVMFYKSDKSFFCCRIAHIFSNEVAQITKIPSNIICLQSKVIWRRHIWAFSIDFLLISGNVSILSLGGRRCEVAWPNYREELRKNHKNA